MKWHALKEEEILRKLKVEPSMGLSSKDVEECLADYGPNELQAEEGPSTLGIFLRQFKDLLIIILLIATVLSALVGEVFDALLILLIILFSAGLGFLQRYKAERAIEALKKIFSPTITALRDGSESVVLSKELVPGDILILNAGDRVPADAIVLKSHSLKVDEASLTGESVPVEKITGVLHPETNLAERNNMLFSGTVVTYGRGKGVVVNTGMHTEIGKIAREVGAVKQEKTPLERRTEEIGKWLGAVILIICFSVAGLGMVRAAISGTLTFEFILSMVMFAVALAVAAVPEALVAIVTGTLAIGMREMAKRNALIRRMPAVETLGSVTVICSDKTGTITKGEMTVKKIYAGGEVIEVSGVGYEPAGTFSPEVTTKGLSSYIRAGLLCNDAQLYQEDDRWLIKGDPTEGALVVLAAKAGMNIKAVIQNNQRIDEIPFSSERKRMTTINRLEKGEKVAYMKGAPEVVISRCSYELKDGSPQPLNKESRKKLLKVAESMAGEGLRVLALASRSLEGGPEEIEAGMSFLGFIGMIDPPREGAVEAVRVCKEVRIKPVMITGDHKLTAMAVAREVGIYHEGDIALTGTEFEALSDEDYEAIVERVSVYARVSPLDKLKIIRAWKKKGQIVAMTGDGVNDAPALKEADIGVAMGIKGTEVSKEAADMILADDNFATIIMAIERGRWIYDNIKKYLTYLLKSNFIEVAVIGGMAIYMGTEHLPLLPAALLYINLATDGLPALALGIAPPEPDIMKRPPRDPKESVFSIEVNSFILLTLVIEVPLFSWIFLSAKDLTTARTILFFLFVIIELVLALNFRSLRYSIFKVPPHRWLIMAVLLNVIITFLIVQYPQVRDSFGITLPSMTDIGMMIAIALGITAAIELTKAFLRRKIR